MVVSPRMFSRQLHGRYYQFLYSISLLLTLWEPTPQMVKHTQTVCRQFADELFECVWPFCGVGAEKVKTKNKWLTVNLSVWQFEKRKTDLIFHNLVPRAVKKKLWRRMISRKIFTWFESSVVKKSKLIYAKPWIFLNGWFEQ